MISLKSETPIGSRFFLVFMAVLPFIPFLNFIKNTNQLSIIFRYFQRNYKSKKSKIIKLKKILYIGVYPNSWITKTGMRFIWRLFFINLKLNY